MSQEKELLQSGDGGLLLVGLPKISEIIISAMARKTGRTAAELIGVAIENLANRLLTEDERAEIVRRIKEQMR